jgi:hypothetical protein
VNIDSACKFLAFDVDLRFNLPINALPPGGFVGVAGVQIGISLAMSPMRGHLAEAESSVELASGLF